MTIEILHTQNGLFELPFIESLPFNQDATTCKHGDLLIDYKLQT